MDINKRKFSIGDIVRIKDSYMRDLIIKGVADEYRRFSAIKDYLGDEIEIIDFAFFGYHVKKKNYKGTDLSPMLNLVLKEDQIELVVYGVDDMIRKAIDDCFGYPEKNDYGAKEHTTPLDQYFFEHGVDFGHINENSPDIIREVEPTVLSEQREQLQFSRENISRLYMERLRDYQDNFNYDFQYWNSGSTGYTVNSGASTGFNNMINDSSDSTGNWLYSNGNILV